MLSLAAPFIPTFFKDPLDEIMPYTDYVIGNEAEALAFSESHGWGIKEIPEIAKKMATLPKQNTQRPRIVIITQGTDPTIAAVSNGSGEVEIKQTPIHALASEQINDTNGAG